MVLDFDVSVKIDGNLIFFIKCIPSPWLDDPHSKHIDIFDNITSTSSLLHAHKISKFTLNSLSNETCFPKKHIAFLDNVFDANFADDPVATDWEEIHLRNFKCCIHSWLWSVYFKVFHKAITFNDF